MARVKLRCIMGCPGLKSSYQEKRLFEFMEGACPRLVHWFNNLSSQKEFTILINLNYHKDYDILYYFKCIKFDYFMLALWRLEHFVESVQIRSYFWSVFSCIQSEYRKIRSRNNSVFEHSPHSRAYGKPLWRLKNFCFNKIENCG